MAEGSADIPLFQSGVVFHKQVNALRDDLRWYLIREYLKAVRDDMELKIFHDGIVFFDLAPAVMREFI